MRFFVYIFMADPCAAVPILSGIWMMITTFTGLRNSCFIMAFAAIFLCIYAFFKNREEAMLIFKNMHFSFMTKKKPIIMEQTGYAFSPFMLVATVLFYLAVFL